jgi:hypothetical protein
MSGFPSRSLIRQLKSYVPTAITDSGEWIVGLLMTRLTPTIQPLRLHGPCLVLGAAPDPILPHDFSADWILLTANSAQAGLRALGCDRRPDVTVMNGQLVGDKATRVARKAAISGLGTAHLVLIERRVPSQTSINVLRSIDYEFSKLTILSHWQRSNIWYRVLQHYEATPSGCRKISTGVFTALFALHSGAAPVVLSGFSLTRPGHSYDPRGRNFHVKADLFALETAARKKLPLFAADRGLSGETGLPLWSGE